MGKQSKRVFKGVKSG